MFCQNPKCAKEFSDKIGKPIGGKPRKFCSHYCAAAEGKRRRYRDLHPFDARTLIRSPEVRAKISAKLKGRKIPPEVLERRIKTQTGAKRSPEFCIAVRERMKGKKWPRELIEKSAAARRGKKLTDEHRAALVAAANRYPPEIKHAVRVLGKLKRLINEKQD